MHIKIITLYTFVMQFLVWSIAVSDHLKAQKDKLLILSREPRADRIQKDEYRKIEFSSYFFSTKTFLNWSIFLTPHGAVECICNYYLCYYDQSACIPSFLQNTNTNTNTEMADATYFNVVDIYIKARCDGMHNHVILDGQSNELSSNVMWLLEKWCDKNDIMPNPYADLRCIFCWLSPIINLCGWHPRVL